MNSSKVKPVFVYPGFGSQWKRMGAGLMENELFRTVINEIDKQWTRFESWRIGEEILKSVDASGMDDPAIGYPCTMALEIALTRLLKERGIEPAAVTGHSGGEIIAAYTAGILSLKDAIKVVWGHTLIMRKEKSGAMAYVALAPARVKEILTGSGLEDRIFIGSYSSPKASILTGEKEAVEHVVQRLNKEKVFVKLLNIPTPFHSPFIRPFQREFFQNIKGMRRRKGRLPIYSALHGGAAKDTDYSSSFWKEHFVEPVKFSATIRTILEQGYDLFLEVSPHPVLSQSIKETIEDFGQIDARVVGTLKRDENEKEMVERCLDALTSKASPPPAGAIRQEEEVSALVRRALAEVMKGKTIALHDIHRGFFDLGLDSLGALKLRDLLSEGLGLSLPASLVFDNPDLHTLTQYLSARMEGKSSVVIDTGKLGRAPSLNEPVAVIGMACRFPGGANTIESFWELLKSGRDTVGNIPVGRWDSGAFYAPELEPGKSITRQGNFISGLDIGAFDAGFFHITPKEARAMDPQQRLLLEVTVEALQDASVPLPDLRGRGLGVYIGMCMDDYKKAHLFSPDYSNMDAYSGTGAMFSPAAGRIAYFLGTRGPAAVVSTACSSTLTALHFAVRALRSGECEMALAGGVNLMLSPHMFVYLSQLKTLSADGTCKTFDEKADGFGRGEGCGILVLKPLSSALADRDNIRAIIKGTAMNHDGASTGFTAPSGIAQREVIARALADAGVGPESIDYVEAHGAGTPLGDPIEINAISETYGLGRSRENPVLVGSVKTNIGHLEGAAGAAGLIKTILALQHRRIPAHLHLNTPNPLMDWGQIPIRVPENLIPWPRREGPARAGLSGFGFSGTNAHVILEEPPPGEEVMRTGSNSGSGSKPPSTYILPFSAKSPGALKELSRSYWEFLGRPEAPELRDICYTAAVGRSHFDYRYAVVGKDRGQLRKKLEVFQTKPGQLPALAPDEDRRAKKTVFLFTGQGSQYVGMGRELYESEPVFREQMNRCAALFNNHIGVNLVELLYAAGADEAKLSQALYAQPVIFSVENALAELWRSWGVEPSLVMGHSIGEYAAARSAGILSLEDAVKLVAIRGRLMQSVTEPGCMVGVLTNEKNARTLMGNTPGISIAAVNAPENVTLSGSLTAVDRVVEKIKQAKIFVEPLPISHAFHSRLMDPYVEQFFREIEGITFSSPNLPVISTILGSEAGREMAEPGYWSRHFCRTVYYYNSLKLAWEKGYRVFIEIGGTAALSGLAGQSLPPEGESSDTGLFLPSLRKGKDAGEQILTSWAQLYVRGMDIDWRRFYKNAPGRKVPLPHYPFQRERYWHEGMDNRDTTGNSQIDKSFCGGIGGGFLEKSPRPAEGTESTPKDLEIVIREMIASQSGGDPEEIPGDVDLFSLGLDSLMLTELRRKINGRYSIDITLNLFFMELTTVDKIVSYIENMRPDGSGRDIEREAEPLAHKESLPKHTNTLTSVPSVSSVAAKKPVAKPLNFSAQADLRQRGYTLQQQRHLEELIQKYTHRTRSSKQQTAASRRYLADSKATVGFNIATKELIYPIVGKRAVGSRVWDIDDNRYIDVTMGFGVYLLGHHPAVVVEALGELGPESTELGPRSYVVGEVAELICRLTGHERVTFANTGTEAVMAAIRLARAATRRDKIVMFSRSYHGHSDGTLAVSYNREGKIHTEPVSPGIPQEVINNVLVLDYLNPDSLEIIAANAPRLAAVLVEPVQARDPGLEPGRFLHRLRKITRESGTLLIFDEMITGFRIHLGGAQAYFNVEADICTYGKIIGGGLPIGVIAGKTEYMDHIDGGYWEYGDNSYPRVERTFFGGTFCQYHEAMVTARAVLTYLQQQGPDLQNRLNRKTEAFARRLNTYFEENRVAVRLNHFGSIFRFDIVGNQDLFFYHMLEKGVYIWEWRNCFLSTVHSDEDLDMVTEAVKETVSQLEQGGFSLRRSESPDPDNIFPMSSVQKRLHVLSQSDQGQRAYFLPIALRVQGSFRIDRVESLLKELLERHEILRTGFEIKDQQLIQRIYPPAEVEFSIRYKKSGSDPWDRVVIDESVEEVLQPFDLSKPPLMRVSITEFSPDHFIFIMNFHHNIMDGSSYAVFVRDFVRLYKGETLPRLKLQYKDYVKWEQQYLESPAFREQQEFWRSRLAGELPALELPADFPYPETLDFSGKTHHRKIGREMTGKLKELGLKGGASINMMVLALFNVLLFKLTGREDILVGIPAVLREREEFRHTVGMFTNTLVLRSYPQPRRTFFQFLSQVKHSFLQAYTHQEYPYEALVADLAHSGTTRQNAFFTAAISYESGDSHLFKIPGLTFSNIQINQGATPFDLFVWVIEEEGELNIGLNYRTSLFREETAARWGNYFEKAMDAVIRDPGCLLGELDLIPDEEKQRILREFNDTCTGSPVEKTLPRLFVGQVEQNPHQVALVGHCWDRNQHEKADSGLHTLTYKEMFDKILAVAGYLYKEGVGPDTLVGLRLDRSIEMMVGIFGILLAGGGYLPIDPAFPEARVKYMLADSRVGMVLTAEMISARENRSNHSGAVDLPYNRLESGALAYAIYTSGTTGRPKGSLNTHANVIRVVRDNNYMEIYGTDRFMQLSNFAFDGSVFDIYGALLNGAALVLVRGEEAASVPKLARVIRKQAITVFFVTTSLFNLLIDRELSALSQVRKVLFGGERASLEHSRKALQFLGPGSLINVYGPTETTVYAACYNLHRIDKKMLSLSIGSPIAHTEIYILDRSLNAVPLMVYGEIYIGGDGVCRGYMNNPELTRGRFFTPDRLRLRGKAPLASGDKIYRTGDLARWQPDGNIEFLGRVDQQIKIRGNRVELGEIETRLREQESIEEAVVVSYRDEGGEHYLCAYIVPAKGNPGELEQVKLRENLAGLLPVFMIPSFFVELEELPLNKSGKVDRRALPLPGKLVEKERAYTPPRDDLEKKLARLWAQALNVPVETLGREDNFFHLGGHSLKGALLAAEIEKEFVVRFPLNVLFQIPTVSKTAAFIRRARPQASATVLVVEKKEYYPLTSPQKRLFFLDRLENIGTSYHTPELVEIRGNLDRKKLANALQVLVNRHEALRTSFHLVENEPVQRIHDKAMFEMNHEQVTGDGAVPAPLSPDLLSEAIEKFIRPFDLTQAPLLRAGLIEIQGKDRFLVVDMHHIISDGTSLGIFLGEIMARLTGQDLPPLKIQYKDYAEYRKKRDNSMEISRQEAYWLKQFAGEVPELELPLDRPRPPVQDFSGEMFNFKIDGRRTRALRRLARDNDATLYMVLLTAFTLLMAKISSSEDITVGTPLAGRNLLETQPVMGMFVNTLVMRSSPHPARTMTGLLRQIKDNTLGAFANQDYPLENLVEKKAGNRDKGRNPLFDTMFALQNIDMPEYRMEGLVLKPRTYDRGISIMDLFLQVFETGDTLTCGMNYCTKLFEEETIRRFVGYWQRIISFFIESPQNLEQPIAHLEIIEPEEKERILIDFNKTETDYPHHETIDALFAGIVEQSPDSTALTGPSLMGEGEAQLTYRELSKGSSGVAQWLNTRGLVSEFIIGIEAKRSLEMVMGILGISRGGGAYLPLDPQNPEERNNYMLKDAGAAEVISPDTVLSLAERRQGNPEPEKAGKPGLISPPHRLAYIIYTSGSSGEPKGVMVEHRNIIRLVKNSNYFPFHERHRILQTGVLAFDASTFEIWGTLLNGGGLVLAERDVVMTPSFLKEALYRHHIGAMWMTSPLFNQMVGEDAALFRPLQYVLVGGDTLSPRHINRVRQMCPGLKVINGYGPTENTTFSTTFLIDKEYDTPIPIGKPIANSSAYIVDKSGFLQPVAIAGELLVGGDGVSRGYMNNPELTAKKYNINFLRGARRAPRRGPIKSFIEKSSFASGWQRLYRTGDLARWQPEGNIEFLGRKDRQVKIRGNRLEMGEIEKVITARPGVKDAAVIIREGPDREKILMAYVVPETFLPGDSALEEEIKAYIARKLPSFMIPSFIIPLPMLPLTPNGKLDRRALPRPGSLGEGKVLIPPDGPEEKILAGFWAEVLGTGIDTVGRESNFFQAGGHSLRAVKLISRIHKAFHIHIPMVLFFKMPTIKDLAVYIRKTGKGLYRSVPPAEKREYYPVSPLQRRFFILNQVGEIKTAYNLCRVAVITGSEKNPLPGFEQIFKTLIVKQESLRTSFAMLGDELVQMVQDRVEFSLEYSEGEEREAEGLIRSFIAPFDLGKAPLLRGKLIKVAVGKYLFLYDMHHIISDGTSVGLFIEEFMALYRGETGTELKIQYKDYCQWQQENRRFFDALKKDKENYWLGCFKGEIPNLDMFTDFPRPPVQSFAGDRMNFAFPERLSTGIHRLMTETDTTLYMVLLAVYTILFSRYTGQEDITVGTPAAGREHVELERIIGLFMNPLPMRNFPKGDLTFLEYLQEVKHTTLQAYENQGYSFGDLVEKLELNEDLSRNPIFQIELLVHNMDMPQWQMEDLTITDFDFSYPVAQIDIALESWEAGKEIKFTLTYCTDLYKPATMDKFVCWFREIAHAVLENPSIKLQDIKMSHHLVTSKTNAYKETATEFDF